MEEDQKPNWNKNTRWRQTKYWIRRQEEKAKDDTNNRRKRRRNEEDDGE